MSKKRGAQGEEQTEEGIILDGLWKMRFMCSGGYALNKDKWMNSVPLASL